MQVGSNEARWSNIWLKDYRQFSQVMGSTLKASRSPGTTGDKLLIWDDVNSKYAWVDQRHVVSYQKSDDTSLSTNEALYRFDTESSLAKTDDTYILDVQHAGSDQFQVATDGSIQIRGGQLLSKVADADGSTSFDLNTDNTITGGGAADANLRELFRVRNNGTEAFHVYANGTVYAQNGFFMGQRRPNDSYYPGTRNRFEIIGTAEDHTNAMSVTMQNYHATATNKNIVGMGMTYIDNADVDQTGVLRGISMFNDCKPGGGTRTLAGPTAAYFAARHTGDFTTYQCNVTNWSMGFFQYNDIATGTGTCTVGSLHYLHLGSPSSSNNVVDITTLYGIRIRDLTNNPNVTEVYAVRVNEQTTNGSASKGNVEMQGGDWNTGHFRLGNAHIWYDTTGGVLRGKTSAPTSASDGTDLMGGGGGGGDSFMEWAGL